MELTGQLAPGWNTTLGGTYYTSRDAHGVSVDTERPRASATLFTAYRLPGAWSKLTLGGGANWQISTYSKVELGEGSVIAKQKAYAVFNLMARCDFSARLSAQLNVNNLFDKKYYLGGRGQPGVLRRAAQPLPEPEGDVLSGVCAGRAGAGQWDKIVTIPI